MTDVLPSAYFERVKKWTGELPRGLFRSRTPYIGALLQSSNRVLEVKYGPYFDLPGTYCIIHGSMPGFGYVPVLVPNARAGTRCAKTKKAWMTITRKRMGRRFLALREM